ncbi:MAG TPA: ATP-binding cassette domain-containing protein, partial [Bacteroidales bacterium]|nr:ATP-binding cassette domain-containing protein [Bacteroidales bacterium]
LLKGFADRVMVMQNGKIVEQGTREQIMEHPVNEYTKALLACRPGQVSKDFKLPVIADFKNDGAFIPQKRSVSVPEQNAILDVQELDVHYRLKHGDFFRALGDINFKTYRGETLGIVGESGCGKTTLSKAILQIIPHKGQIFLNDVPLGYRNRKEELNFRKKVQFVFQDPYSSLNPSIKVGSLIREVLKVHRIKNRAKRVEELLLQVGLDADYAARYPHELSGGQRQRVAIARALATEPDLLILDEAVAALDVSVQAKVLNLLNELKLKLGLTYIFISHDLEVVHYMADRIMVMKDGQIVEAGPSDDVFEKPASAYTKKLIAASPGK